MPGEQLSVRVTINGESHEGRVEPRLLLSDFIRHGAGLTGTHVGCEHGVCGACTVLLEGAPVNGGGNMYRRGGAKLYHGLGGSLSA